ncbi:hypothetical protein BDK51DRAFT_47797 [Blyttiomyces helicus]|uniref:Reverse transcriptase RNase H-like domain-containing protein n=1 Tax=Blyttiomyces helicus TaxID=388810 RepID=A0A4P9WLP8_9FUNG|nr:hypothetical protein BDK51DRAFT_47797 [Blyttiomyces helicus]|eukprot:RKO93959.1 hypothetical protein BDK51DRAFT_47797 [Blyttiomyces helicus]
MPMVHLRQPDLVKVHARPIAASQALMDQISEKPEDENMKSGQNTFLKDLISKNDARSLFQLNLFLPPSQVLPAWTPDRQGAHPAGQADKHILQEVVDLALAVGMGSAGGFQRRRMEEFACVFITTASTLRLYWLGGCIAQATTEDNLTPSPVPHTIEGLTKLPRLCLVPYFSHKMKSAELNYMVHKKELMALVELLKANLHLLMRVAFPMFTDDLLSRFPLYVRNAPTVNNASTFLSTLSSSPAGTSPLSPKSPTSSENPSGLGSGRLHAQ